MSAVPDFWSRCACTLKEQQAFCEEMRLEELTGLMLAWLHEAAAWQDSHGVTIIPVSRPMSSTREESGLPVSLNIYDVSHEVVFKRINMVLAHKRSPVKLGGVFHAGVEVHGLEWSYGFSESETVPGISCVEPGTDTRHRFRQSVKMRPTKVPPDEIAIIISDLLEEYPGDDYSLLRRNCCHFADDFLVRLGVGRAPAWVYRLARMGAKVQSAVEVAQSIRDRLAGSERET
eukprot:gnl/TRDRNA2_/TRDRNA2_34276_c0_seq1.p1 gnl/TRDRNA2_/TRDRNA2_34276_c0~~gnl/TRDRNA2_/TRDRNA2_34276_c0_seq1.p1  ORF type:complete len:251 (-),score=34.99 gnl/TRDRNA2_/TRDRNA2_34276_c0_seq1:89-781(-)